jgi:hypothetical protein
MHKLKFSEIQKPLILLPFSAAEALSSGQLEQKGPTPTVEEEIKGSSMGPQMSQGAGVRPSSQRRISEPSMVESPKTVVSRVSVDLLTALQQQETRRQQSTDTACSQPMGSDKYLYGVLYGCVLMLLYKHRWFLQLCPIPIFVYTVKHTGMCSGRKVIVSNCFLSMFQNRFPNTSY